MAAGVEDERYQQSGVVGMEVDRTATKRCGGRLGGRPRGSGAGQRAHQQRQFETGDVDQVALGDVVAPAQPGSSHAAAVEDVRSMKDAGIFDGDLLVVDRGIAPRTGDIVIAVLHGELTVKRLAMTEAGSILSADNPAYPDIRPGEAGCELWGVVTFSIRHRCGR